MDEKPNQEQERGLLLLLADSTIDRIGRPLFFQALPPNKSTCDCECQPCLHGEGHCEHKPASRMMRA